MFKLSMSERMRNEILNEEQMSLDIYTIPYYKQIPKCLN